MILSSLTFKEGDAMDPVHARTVIEAYDQEWRKLDLFKVHGMPYKPSWQAVKDLKHLGLLVTLCGFDKKEDLKAFYIGVKGPHIYNPEWTYCQDLILYIAPEYRRNPFVFKKFMKELDNQMKKDGVDLYSIAVPADDRFARAHKSIEKNGFNREDLVYMKRTL